MCEYVYVRIYVCMCLFVKAANLECNVILNVISTARANAYIQLPH